MSEVLTTAKKYVGFQETYAPNRGPLVDRWRGMVSPTLAKQPIPWCGCFVAAMLMETLRLDRYHLTEALGFDKLWYPESCDSWLQQVEKHGTTTQNPQPGDIFLLMKPLKPGYSKSDAIHVGFYVAGDIKPGVGFTTLEGNTNAAGSPEGTSVCERRRVWMPGAFVFIHVKEETTT